MVYVPPSGSWLLIIAPSGAKPSIRIDSCFSSLEKNCDQVDSLLETTTLPDIDQAAPDLLIILPLGLLYLNTS